MCLLVSRREWRERLGKGKGGERAGNGEGRERGSWGNSALVVEGIDARGFC